MKTKVKKIVIPQRYFVAVGEGIKFLDVTLGRRVWLKRMNMNKFDIYLTNSCVAGNVFKEAMFDGESTGEDGYDNFLKGINLLGGGGAQIRFGFYSRSEKGMQYLQDIWARSIIKMKKQARIK